MRTSVRQVVTGVTPTLAVATSLAPISANATKASMEMDTLVLVGKGCVFSTSACQQCCSLSVILVSVLACANRTWAHSTHQT